MMSNEGAGSFITSIPSHGQAEAVTGWGFVFKAGELLWWELPSVSPFCSPSACVLFYCLCPDSLVGIHLSIHPLHPELSQQPGVEIIYVSITLNVHQKPEHLQSMGGTSCGYSAGRRKERFY